MASEEPVRMFESEPSSFELTELEAPEEELLGSFLPIGDVAKLIGVNPSVLRFWEQEFPQLRPTKRGNRRYYSSEDVQLIRTIQHLLYEEHYTILGARNKIHELQVQDKAREILEEKVSRPLPVEEPKKVVVKTDMSLILQELRAIRALLTTPVQAQAYKKSPFELGQEQAVTNFSLVSEDLHSLMAQQPLKYEETAQMEDKSQETMQELLAPHSYDLGAFGVDGDGLSESVVTKNEVSEDNSISEEPFQQTSTSSSLGPKASVEEMPIVAETLVDSIEPKTETSVDEFLTSDKVASEAQQNKAVSSPTKQESRAKVDTSRLAVPPLPGERPTFTIGMKVQKSHQQVLTHIAPFLWNKK